MLDDPHCVLVHHLGLQDRTQVVLQARLKVVHQFGVGVIVGAEEFEFVDFVEGVLELAEQVDQLVIIILVPHQIETIHLLGLQLAFPRLELQGEAAAEPVPGFPVLLPKVDDGLDEHLAFDDVWVVLEGCKGNVGEVVDLGGDGASVLNLGDSYSELVEDVVVLDESNDLVGVDAEQSKHHEKRVLYFFCWQTFPHFYEILQVLLAECDGAAGDDLAHEEAEVRNSVWRLSLIHIQLESSSGLFPKDLEVLL